MFEVNGEFVFSPTDLTNAVECEFAVLRGLDVRLGRLKASKSDPDLMLKRTAALGDAHERRVLAQFVAQFGPYDGSQAAGVFTVESPARDNVEQVRAAARRTVELLESGADVVYQAAFLRGRFSGFADFIVRQANGDYAVYDTKLARHAKVSALLQLAAYGDELAATGVPVDPQVHLILGDTSTDSHDLVDLIPVYRERRARLEALVDDHLRDSTYVRWNDARFLACGRCDTCQAEVDEHRDLLLVAGMRSSQRTRLRAAGIETIDDLAAGTTEVAGMRSATLESLRAQAAMQVVQRPPLGAETGVFAKIFKPAALEALPPPDAGDIFFDFEGDPLWSDGDPRVNGLEYLFGVIEADGDSPKFLPFWAHDRIQEQHALEQFLNYVVERRTRFPAMHIYHYAAYEKTSLLRLAARYGVGEAIVDELLVNGALFDLYTLVRAGVRVSQPSYSLKKLEPLYMGNQLRDSNVTNAADSIVAYADYCDMRDAGDAAAADAQLTAIADYNEYDCLSTLRLRDWLVTQAKQHGIEPIGLRAAPPRTPTPDPHFELVARLRRHVGDALPIERNAEQQAVALLAAAVGYHRREDKPFWWAHHDRLAHPVDEWADTSNVLIIEDVEVVQDWQKEGKQKNPRRTLRLTGRLGTGSKIEPGENVFTLYDAENVPAGVEHQPGRRAARSGAQIESCESAPDGRDTLLVIESRHQSSDAFDQLPMATTPSLDIRWTNLCAAIMTLACDVADRLDAGQNATEVLTGQPVLDLLVRRAPHLAGNRTLPEVVDSDYIAALTSAVHSLDNSYLAVQGPPGSGKTYVGARVIAALVADGWRIGVVAQSHKVIENMLSGISDAGVKADHIAKKTSRQGSSDTRWTNLPDDPSFRTFLDGHIDSGCVLGGTVWDFTNRKRVPADSLDLLVIDEAGQFSLANTIAGSTAAKRLLLLGDPQQLPQVSQGTHPDPCDTSALEWIIEGRPVMPSTRGYFLAYTWRMHPDLTRAVSRLAYAGKLRSRESITAQRSLDRVNPGIHVVQVQHEGNTVESTEEAAAVVAQVTDLIGRRWSDPAESDVPRPLAQKDILIVAPYNAQVAVIRRHLDQAGFQLVKVGSVDRFQGQEAPVVIVSMTASAPEDVPRGMDFLLSRNRINVAVSRGKWCAIIVRSPRLTDYLPTSPSALARLGAFIGLCQSPAVADSGPR